MFYDLKKFLKRLKAAGIAFEVSGTGKYKGDYYITQGKFTPHIHASSDGNFVGVKNKQGAIKTVVFNGNANTGTIDEILAELADATSTGEVNVRNALTQLSQLAALGN